MDNVKCGREKYWNELTPDEKVERMRTILRRQTSQIEDMQRTLNLLMNHSHNPVNGKLAVPLEDKRNTGQDFRQPLGDDCYF